MSKSNSKKITADTKCNTDSRRPSVFERLGTKPTLTAATQNTSDYCRNWALNGNCSYGKNCKYANTHTLISPSKRVKKDNVSIKSSLFNEEAFKRLSSKIVKTSPDLNLEEWDQTELEYQDENVLEKRRELLQKELELQMKKDKEVHGNDKIIKHKKKVMSSTSSSSHSSSTSSCSSSSSSDDSSSSSTSDSHKKLNKFKKLKHRSASPHNDDKERKKKLKLKRIGATKSDNKEASKKLKRKVDTAVKKDVICPKVKKASSSPTKKHVKSPCLTTAHCSVRKLSKERNRSESPKVKAKEVADKARHHVKKSREPEVVCKDAVKSKTVEKMKNDFDKSKSYSTEEKSVRCDERSKPRSRDRERRSRTPKQQLALPIKSKQSRSPEKSCKTQSSRHQEKAPRRVSRCRELDKKERESQSSKRERSKDKDCRIKSRLSTSQEEGATNRKSSRDVEERSRQRERSKERRDKEQRSHSRPTRTERDELAERRPRDRSRDRDKDKRDTTDKSSRYSRDRVEKEDKDRTRERRRSSQRFENRYPDKEAAHKSVERDRFIRERSIDRMLDKNAASSSSRDHLVDREAIYDRDRHRRFAATRYDRDHDRKELANKIDRRQSPHRSIDLDRNFERVYPRLASERWDEQHDDAAPSAPRPDHRDHHGREDDRRKADEPRRYSPFNERHARDDRSKSRYTERPFDDLHHPMYSADKLRQGRIRDETVEENWDVHHDLEHAPREHVWEEREWRSRALWERDSLPRSVDAHDEDWSSRYDSPMTADWKLNESRKWTDGSSVHLRGSYRNERLKEMDVAEPVHGKRRSYNTPEVREESTSHVTTKQSALHASMQEEPINKKLMELAEGKCRKSREKSAESYKNKPSTPALSKDKSDSKEMIPPEAKRPCLEEPLPSIHTESDDLSDISDDPDDILNMDDEIPDTKITSNDGQENPERDSVTSQNQEFCHSPSKVSNDEVFHKEKESSEPLSYSMKQMDDEHMETMDFEEISDGELEEEIKTSCKGLGDALGVDWESLVKESLPRRPTTLNLMPDRWHCKTLFQRIGISVSSVRSSILDTLINKYADGEKFLVDDLAMMHTAMVRNSFNHNRNHLSDSTLNDNCLYMANEETDINFTDAELKPCTNLYDQVQLLLKQAA